MIRAAIIAAAIMAASPAIAQSRTDTAVKMCDANAALAETVMKVRQDGEPVANFVEMMFRNEGKDEQQLQLMRMIVEAYAEPLHTEVADKIIAARKMRDRYRAECRAKNGLPELRA